jgi:hypothetical protein
MRSGQYVASRQDDDTGEGYQELRPRVLCERYGLPDIGVCIQGDLKAVIYGRAGRVVETTSFGYRDLWGGSKELWNMWLRARRTTEGLLMGVLDEVRCYKNFTISEVGDRGGCQKTITPSSLR